MDRYRAENNRISMLIMICIDLGVPTYRYIDIYGRIGWLFCCLFAGWNGNDNNSNRIECWEFFFRQPHPWDSSIALFFIHTRIDWSIHVSLQLKIRQKKTFWFNHNTFGLGVFTFKRHKRADMYTPTPRWILAVASKKLTIRFSLLRTDTR